jgi:hypothetical protein
MPRRYPGISKNGRTRIQSVNYPQIPGHVAVEMWITKTERLN